MNDHERLAKGGQQLQVPIVRQHHSACHCLSAATDLSHSWLHPAVRASVEGWCEDRHDGSCQALLLARCATNPGCLQALQGKAEFVGGTTWARMFLGKQTWCLRGMAAISVFVSHTIHGRQAIRPADIHRSAYAPVCLMLEQYACKLTCFWITDPRPQTDTRSSTVSLSSRCP